MKGGGQILWNAIAICEMSKTSGEPHKGPIIPFGAAVEHHPSSPKDQSRIHQFGKEVLPGIFLGYELTAQGIWKGDILIADFGRFGNDGFIGKLPSKNDDEFVFPFAEGTAKLLGRDFEFRVPTPRREQPERSEDLSGEIHGESGESQQAQLTDDAEARGDLWSIQGGFIHRHHTEPRVELNVPKEETFPISLKYFDVTRSTRTDLDVMQVKKIDDYWNVDSSKHLSDSWRGFTTFTPLKEKPPKGYMWSGERLTQIRTTTRPDCGMARSLDENW